jgi:CBS-domain-containing membrane protein
MPDEAEGLGEGIIRKTDSGVLSGLYDAILFVAVLGFSAVALLAVALAAPLAIAVSALAGAASAAFAGAERRGGWQAATPA